VTRSRTAEQRIRLDVLSKFIGVGVLRRQPRRSDDDGSIVGIELASLEPRGSQKRSDIGEDMGFRRFSPVAENLDSAEHQSFRRAVRVLTTTLMTS